MMTPGIRPLAAMAAFLVLTAACTAEPERDLPDAFIGSATASPTTNPSSAGDSNVPTDVGRLAVVDDLGNLVTVAPDGSDAIVMAEAVEGQTLLQQPTWSPDGDRLAWVRVEVSDAGTSSALVTATADGTRPTEAPTSGAPFYLSWDPTSSRIAYLGPSPSVPSDIELGVVEVADGGAQAVPLDAGGSYYLSWDPLGGEMLVHVGTDRLERLELDGTLTTVDPLPGTFNVPVWTSDGGSLVYASRMGDAQRLVVHDLGRDRGRALVRFEGAINFVVSPDGSRVAYQVLGDPENPAPLLVIDRESGEIVPMASGPSPAFFWSPAGDSLLYLLPEVGSDRVWFRWSVWDGESTFTTPRFTPSLVFGRDYLQFFEQYAQSMSLWAPDGSAFAYAGSNETGEQGIWVQPARSGAEPILVTDGVFAAWSPA